LNTDKKYVKCCVCGKPIYLGEKVICKNHYAGLYCSHNCFANSFNIDCCEKILNEKLAFLFDHTVYTDSDKNNENNGKKDFYDLMYIVATNLTSITRYVKLERSKYPNLTEGQFLDRHLEYRELARVAVDNIMNCINEKVEQERTERKHNVREDNN
jgi:hypothetical protein